MIEPRCALCAHWDTRDALVGWCQEITGVFRALPETCVDGLATCRTAAVGSCRLFTPSDETLREEKAWKDHENDLRRAAGTDYPASLAR
ncbi:hypothetical protein JCM15519_26960 [Fundidesulfovibrio butyratiphilus]